jgi:hypothetical protein
MTRTKLIIGLLLAALTLALGICHQLARLGILLNDQTLLYGVGGWTQVAGDFLDIAF